MPREYITLNAECTGARDVGDHVELDFADGPTVRADVAIGADGIHSAKRNSMIPDDPRFIGRTAYGCLIPVERLPGLVDELKMVARRSLLHVRHKGERLRLACKGKTDVLRQAYTRAAVDPADVQYVELHGTGTKTGDPVEAAALGAGLGARLGAERTPDGPVLVVSAKTNVGHLEGAAGITGLLKVALAI